MQKLAWEQYEPPQLRSRFKIRFSKGPSDHLVWQDFTTAGEFGTRTDALEQALLALKIPGVIAVRIDEIMEPSTAK